jgi:hypothetical protein
MFINNLQFWLSSVLSLLITIDQETILDFLGIYDRFNNEEYAELLGVEVSTPVSSETFKLIIQHIWEHYQHGLGFVDIENLAVFILVIRFIFLSKKYNIKTGFFIVCIGLGAGYLWYMHLRDLAYYYSRTLWMSPLTHNLGYDFEEVFYERLEMFGKVGTDFDTGKFYAPILRGFVAITNNNDYRYDPISMLWAYLPTDIHFLSDKIYYFMTLKIIPETYRFVTVQLTYLSSMLWYTFIVRINKRYCPYLIRWHWTFLLGADFIQRPLIYVQNRLIYYVNETLIPNGYFRELELVQGMLCTLVAVQYVFLVLGLLHALCGQYFYFPLLTENTELHIGLRPKDSLYSGGHTIWQDKRAFMISRNASRKLGKYRWGTIRQAYSMLPRFWYGWLGRGTLDDMTTTDYEKYLKDKDNKESIQKAKRRNSKILWHYRRERLKKRFLQLLAKFGIKFDGLDEDDGDDLLEEFKNFTKK